MSKAEKPWSGWRYKDDCTCTWCVKERDARVANALRVAGLIQRGHDTIATKHSFDVDNNFQSGKFYVIRLDGMPHYPTTTHSSLTSARERAEELSIKTGKKFAVISVVGICSPPARPSPRWS